jgi:signal peptidase I
MLSSNMSLTWRNVDLAKPELAVRPGNNIVREHPVFEPELQPEIHRPAPGLRRRILRHLFQLAFVALLGAGSYWFFSQYVLQSVEVVGASMLPTLHNEDHYLLNKWTYFVRDPEPNDIVVIRNPDDGKYSVKRIVACAGDSVLLKNGKVYVNGRVLDEPYLEPGTLTFASGTKNGEVWTICGKDHYFVLGDNRKNSEDSRAYGPILRRNIVGAVDR